MKLELKKFHMSMMEPDSVVLYLGARRTGKSVLVIDTLRHFKDFPIGVAISPTEQSNETFSAVMPRMLIYDEYTADILEKFVERQKKITEQKKQEVKKYGRSDIDSRAFLLMDDCLYDKSWLNDKNIRYTFLNGRHASILYLLTMQFPLGIPPNLRANVDWVFINRNSNIKERERIYHQYAGMFPTFDTFCQVLDECTNNFECLVIHKSARSNRLDEQVFWYKADPTVNYKICSKELWDLQTMDDERRAMGMAEPGDDEEMYDPSKIIKKGRGPSLTVRKKQ